MVVIGVLLLRPTLVEGDQMSWLDSMIDNIAQDARQTKAVQYDQLSWIRNRKVFKRDRDVNFAREDSAIQRRIADARSAGVHPLFALGGSVQSSPAFFMGGGSTAAQSPGGGGGGGIPDAMEVEAHKAAMRESAARAAVYEKQAEREDFALSAERASALARAKQASNSQQDVLLLPPGPPVSQQNFNVGPSANAQRVQDEYGDVVEWIYGAARLLMDTLVYNQQLAPPWNQDQRNFPGEYRQQIDRMRPKSWDK